MFKKEAQQIGKAQGRKLEAFKKFIQEKNIHFDLLDFAKSYVVEDDLCTVGADLEIPFKKYKNVHESVSMRIYSDLSLSGGEKKPCTLVSLSLGVKKHRNSYQQIANSIFKHKKFVNLTQEDFIYWDARSEYNFYQTKHLKGEFYIERITTNYAQDLLISKFIKKDLLRSRQTYFELIEEIKYFEKCFIENFKEIENFVLRGNKKTKTTRKKTSKRLMNYDERRQIELYAVEVAAKVVWNKFGGTKKNFHFKKHVEDLSYGEDGVYPGYDLIVKTSLGDFQVEVKGTLSSLFSIELTPNETNYLNDPKEGKDSYLLVVVADINLKKKKHKIYFGQWQSDDFRFVDENGVECEYQYEEKVSDTFRLSR